MQFKKQTDQNYTIFQVKTNNDQNTFLPFFYHTKYLLALEKN